MRRLSWLLLVLAGCAGPDADPLDVAERFHEFRHAGDDRGIHALLSEADRAAIPFQAFPMALPPSLELDVLGWNAPLDSATLLNLGEDTAQVVLHVQRLGRDTLRLVATREPRGFWKLRLDKVRWRIAMGLAEATLLDSLATAMRPRNADAARAYLTAAKRYPAAARPADVDFARSTVREATVADALRIQLRVAPSFTGTMYIAGEIENPTRNRIATLRLIVRDGGGGEQAVELWDVAPGSTTPVMQLTGLRRGDVQTRLDRIQVF